jgi:hypothetical protein
MTDAAAPTAVQTSLNLIINLKQTDESKKAIADLVKMLQDMGGSNPVAAGLEKSNIVHFARFLLLEGGTKVAILTEFDGSFKDYTYAFADLLDDMFNAVLEHAEDAPPLPVRSHPQEFFEFVQKYNVEPLLPLYSAYPNLTVLDIRALQAASEGG